jgi:DNA-binding transcriptional LysR family regulator
MIMRIDPQRLIRLAVLIKQRSFRKAADVLGITQPALSQSIAQLEQAIGVKLIERTTHGMEPTIYGEALYAHARAIDWELSLAERRVQELIAGSKGTLTVGATTGIAMSMISQAIPVLLASTPEVHSRVLEELTAEPLLRQLQDRGIDVLICPTAPGYELKGLQSIPLFYTSRVACIRAGHPLGESPSLSELVAYPFSCPPDAMGLLSSVREIFAEAGLEMPTSINIVSNSVSLAKEVVKNTDAFAIFTDLSIWQECKYGELVAIPLPVKAGSWYNLVTRHEYVGTGATKNFLKAIFAVSEARGIEINPQAREVEQRIPKDEFSGAKMNRLNH